MVYTSTAFNVALNVLTIISLIIFPIAAQAEGETPALQMPSNPRACYWPDGTQTGQNQTDPYHYTPCFEGDSQCCALGEVCMTNGLCYGGVEGQVYRGACTDQTYRTAKCPTFCQDSFPSSWANLVPCELNGDGQWQWWCGHWDQTKWCTAGKNASLLTYPRGNVSKILGVKNIDTKNTSSSTTLVSGTPDPPQTSCSASPATRQRMLISVGMGIGVPLVIALVVLAIMLFKEKRQSKGLRNSLDQQKQYVEESKNYQDGGYAPGELSANSVYELGETGRTPELDVKRATLNHWVPARKSVQPN